MKLCSAKRCNFKSVQKVPLIFHGLNLMWKFLLQAITHLHKHQCIVVCFASYSCGVSPDRQFRWYNPLNRTCRKLDIDYQLKLTMECQHYFPNDPWPDIRIRLFAHYTTLLSSLCRRIWRYWNYKWLVRYILSSVCLKLNQFSQLYFMQYMGLCVFTLPF